MLQKKNDVYILFGCFTWTFSVAALQGEGMVGGISQNVFLALSPPPSHLANNNKCVNIRTTLTVSS